MIPIYLFFNINFGYLIFMTSPPEMVVGAWSLYGGLFFVVFLMCVFLIAHTLREVGRCGPETLLNMLNTPVG